MVAPSSRELDLEHPRNIRTFVRELRPAVIVNAAAYTAVDRAEIEQSRCHALNVEAPATLAEEAHRAGAIFLHYSTDYVFNGQQDTPYEESDTTEPLNYYGQTKLDGERAVQAAGSAHFVLRTSWLYGAHGNNFLNAIVRRARLGAPLRIVNDQHGTPTWCRDVAEASTQILQCSLHAERCDVPFGLYHLAARGHTTWYDFGLAILAGDARLGRIAVAPTVQAISTAQYPTGAMRPPFSALNSDRVHLAFPVCMPPWRESLKQVLQELAATPSTAEQTARS